MPTTVLGVVHEGRVVPETPLPEGAQVEILLHDEDAELVEVLRDELEGWDRASAKALDLVDRLS